MTYWTVLWITIISGPLDGAVTGLVYRSEAECLAAHQIVAKTLGGAYDYQIKCEPGDVASGSARPKRRPGEANDETTTEEPK